MIPQLLQTYPRYCGCEARLEIWSDGRGNVSDYEVPCTCPKAEDVAPKFRAGAEGRVCVDCDTDISDRPPHSIRCLRCAKDSNAAGSKLAGQKRRLACMNPECENARKVEAKWCLPCSNRLAKVARREDQRRKRAEIRNEGSGV